MTDSNRLSEAHRARLDQLLSANKQETAKRAERADIVALVAKRRALLILFFGPLILGGVCLLIVAWGSR